MGDILLDNESTPATPASGKTVVYVDTTAKEAVSLTDAGTAKVLRTLTNANTTGQSIATSNTYITNSNITIPPAGLRAGAIFEWVFGISRSGTGTAQPVYTVVYGTNGTTSDTARITMTGVAQVSGADTGVHRIYVVARSVGSGTSGVIQGLGEQHHSGTTTGLANQAQVQIFTGSGALSSGFDTTPAGSIIGICINPGANSTWVYDSVIARGYNL